MPLLQVISTSPFDSKTIQQAGADRIQLVSALEIGGLTPSYGIIRKSLQCVDIPTVVMIRHHNNGFVHTQAEIDLFCNQIQYCKLIGVKGIVVGGISQNKQIDTKLLSRIKSEINSQKIQITFHKAFDQVNDIVKCYQTLNQHKITRILTQGGTQPIENNEYILKKIIDISKKQNGTKILLGGGINYNNVLNIIDHTGAEEIHIGTCVRENKYGPVLKQKVRQFVQLIKK